VLDDDMPACGEQRRAGTIWVEDRQVIDGDDLAEVVWAT
jgi:hypothetical protein